MMRARTVARLVGVGSSFWLSAQVAAQAVDTTANQKLLSDKLRSQIEQVVDTTPGVIGVSLIDMTTGKTIGVNDELTFPTASSIKLVVEAAMYREIAAGKLNLDHVYKVDLGKGLVEKSLRDISFAMINDSDNYATNAIIDLVGFERINQLSKDAGIKSILLRRRMLDTRSGQQDLENIATPADAARFMEKFLNCDLPIPRTQCMEMRDVAYQTYPAGPVRQQIPAVVRVIQMPGGLEGVRNSWAAVDLPNRPFAMAIMGHFGDFDTLTVAIRRITDLAYDHFRRLAGANMYGVRNGPQLAPRKAN